MNTTGSPIHGICTVEFPRVETAVYTWDLRVPAKSKLVDGFKDPRAPKQISETIRFDTGVLASAQHSWTMTLRSNRLWVTFVLPQDESGKEYSVQNLRLDFFKNSQKVVSFEPDGIRNQYDNSVEYGLYHSHPAWTEDMDTIRFVWTIQVVLGRLALKKIQENLYPDPEDYSVPNDKFCDFSDLYLSDHLSDLVIVCGGEQISAHRSILFGKSSVFAAMFLHEMRENKEKLLTIEDIHPRIFKEMLRYLYTYKVNNLDDVCFDLLPVAEKYQLVGLKILCEMTLEKKVTPENSLELYKLGEMYRANRLKKKCLKVLKLSNADFRKDREKLKAMNRKDPDLVFDLLLE